MIDPRFFRLPSAIFTMVRVRALPATFRHKPHSQSLIKTTIPMSHVALTPEAKAQLRKVAPGLINSKNQSEPSVLTGAATTDAEQPVEDTLTFDLPREKNPHLVAFRVPLNFNKIQIKNYLEEIYRVRVTKVHTLIYVGRNMGRQHRYKKKTDYKKAYVYLEEPFPFPTMEEIGLMSKPANPKLTLKYLEEKGNRIK